MTNHNEAFRHRVGYLDMLKAFAIFMVFVGHRTDSTILEQFIFSFHMPLFFWISGLLFNPDKYPSFKSFFYRRFRTLIVPYFLFAFISFAFWFFVVRSLSIRGQVFALDPWYPFIGIFYGVGAGHWRNPLDIALWFLPCLFVTEMIFWHVNKHLHGIFQVFAIILFGIIGYITSVWMPFRLSWSADVAFSSLVFYYAGNYSRNWIGKKINLPGAWKIMIMISLLCSGFSLCIINGKADMNYNFFGNPFYFYFAAFAGIYFWYYVIKLLPAAKAITYIGQNTIILIGLAGVSSFVLRGLHYLMSGALSAEGKTGIIETVISSVLTIGLLIPVTHIMNRFTPFLLGRER